jgi:hypothetical protein
VESARESALAPRETIRNHAAFIWSVADLLRGDYKQSEYGKVILPLTVIRRLDCVLEPTNLDFRCVYLTLLRGGCGQAGGKL